MSNGTRPAKLTSNKKASIYQIIIHIKNPHGELVQTPEDGKPSDELKINSTMFSLNMLSLNGKTDGYSKFPYMIEHRKLPSDKLYSLLITGYENVVRFFFDKRFFITTIGPNEVYIQDENAEQDQILEYNVNLMLELLFPTSYPVPRNNFNSYGHYMTNEDTVVFVKGQIQDKLLGKPLFTYINIEGSKYTITRTVLLNDVYNNPVYRVLINEYGRFVDWLSDSKPKVVKEVRGVIEKLLNNKLWKELFSISAESTNSKTKIKTPAPVITEFHYSISQKYDDILDLYESSKTRYSANSDTYKRILKSLEVIYATATELYDATKPASNGANAGELIQTLTQFSKPEEIESSEDDNADEEKKFLNQKSFKNFIKYITIIKEQYDKLIELDSRIFTQDVYELMRLIPIAQSKIFMSMKVYNTYLKPKKYIVEETDENIRAELNKNYETLVNYGKSVQNLARVVSSNKVLQHAVDSYIRSNETDNSFKILLEEIYAAVFRNKLIINVVSETSKKLLNTGVGRINTNDKDKPQYEVYLGMDLIKGELTQEIVPKIKCAYEGYFLGQQLSIWALASNDIDYIVIDLDELVSKSNKKNPEQKVEVNEKKKGGDAPRITRRQYFAFTRKSRKH